MNNEETKILNQSEENAVEKTDTATTTKKSERTGKAAYAAGGFAAGLASGVAGNAFAATPDIPEEVGEEDIIQPAPDPEDVLMATDEGIRIAQVDDDASFAEAFADARAQVGPGGAFEWRGHVYNTYYEDEWNNMSAEERAEYQQKIDYEAISGDTADTYQPAYESVDSGMTTMAANTEMIDEDSADEGIKVLGVEAVVDEFGNPMTVAVVEAGGEQALLVDVDNDGTMDALLADENHDGQLDVEHEVYDISDCNVATEDLMHNMAANENPDMYMAYNDGMPDYMNDADVSSMA